MGKTAFLFAGQGAQYIGMGKELYENFAAARRIFDEADESLGRKLTELIFSGAKEELDLTENTQPAIVAVSMAAYRIIREQGIVADVVAGLSLGEYSALTAAEVFSLSQVVPLVQKRGRFMQEAVAEGTGKMCAILGLTEVKIKEVCAEASRFGVVEPANFNCPGQIVIGGEVRAVDAAAELARKFGALKTIDLPVSAPFHTSMLAPAAERLKIELDKTETGEIKIPVISNVTADYIGSRTDIKDLLYRQVMSSVLFEQSVRRMIADGTNTFVELGPGRTLSGFVKRIDRTVRIYNVEDMASFEATVKGLNI
jgi:[acyl-carrier-protein] S-malonyltransferase